LPIIRTQAVTVGGLVMTDGVPQLEGGGSGLPGRAMLTLPG